VKQTPNGDFPLPANTLRMLLDEFYGISVDNIVRVPIGENTLNYRAFGLTDSYFLKLVEAEHARALEASIRRTMHVLSAGLATPSALPIGMGQFVIIWQGWAVSAWHWEPGDVVTAGWTDSQCQGVGRALAELHRFLRKTELQTEPAPTLYEWARATLETGGATAEDILASASISEWAEHVRWRVERSDQLLSAARNLTGNVQPLHGDFSVVNLLFRGDRVTMTDFSPPLQGHIEYELGRVAFAPQFVSGREYDWRRGAQAVVSAYAEAEGLDASALYRASLLTFLIAMVGSYYALPAPKNGGLTNPSLDVFWTQRVRTVHALYREFSGQNNLNAE
jgi:Ser/Thr protein kinase RdoA (MazF antagonist)